MAVKSGKWSDFGVRLASAAVLGPIALACVWAGGEAWRIFLLVAIVGLGREWGRLAKLPDSGYGQEFLMLALGLAVVLARVGPWLGLVELAAATGFAAWRYGRFAAVGIPYAGLGGIALIWLRLQPVHGLYDTIFLVVTVWGTDIGAYLVGRLLGGPKMAPKISPGKTWSGGVGGLLIGGVAAAILAGGGSGFDAAALPAAFLLSIFAQAGDLMESAIKRRLGVKDSGNTIPGHGGLFDRLDGFLAAAPVAALLALSMQGGLPLWG
ncbi:MAG: phosphatidate cytidylyltransferase [Rhodospirillales bacterium 20-64-7]|nr:MAG: phosphatidate cytidylyltransferase [Rhodospirillales bacterium 20-64-7]